MEASRHGGQFRHCEEAVGQRSSLLVFGWRFSYRGQVFVNDSSQ